MELVNRVANSGLITINLEEYFPQREILHFDLKDYLWKEFILKEKDFRIALKEHDWTQYSDKIVLVYCSNDAIIPVWAYMLVTSYASKTAADVYGMTEEEFLKAHYRKAVEQMDLNDFEGKRIVIKGCSDKPVPASAYLDIQSKLTDFAQSVMYGEPCSTVPIFKKPRKV